MKRIGSYLKSSLIVAAVFSICAPAFPETVQQYAASCAHALGITKVPGYSCQTNSVKVGQLGNPGGVTSKNNYLGKVPTSNPDVYAVFLCRDVTNGRTDLNGYILQNRKTGITCYFDAKRNLSEAQTLRSPEDARADEHWLPPQQMNGTCIECHNTDAFVVTPGLAAGFHQLGLMHSRPMTAYKVVNNSLSGSHFQNWESIINVSANTCAGACHRISGNSFGNSLVTHSLTNGWMAPQAGSAYNFNPASGQLYSMQTNGQILAYLGRSCSGSLCDSWSLLDNNSKTKMLAASKGQLYQLHNDGLVWKFTGTPCNSASCIGWQLLDNNSLTKQITSGDSGLYQLHTTGAIWRYTGSPCSGSNCLGWQKLDVNSATVQIVAAGSNLYQRHSNGAVWKYTGQPCSGNSCSGWQKLDNTAQTVDIVADGNNLYQRRSNGHIWRYTGTPCSGNTCTGWQQLDFNPSTVQIVAGGSNLYQRHNDGAIWRYTGAACSGGACNGWQKLDHNSNTVEISASTAGLYQRHSNGRVWRYTNTPCSSTGCPGWDTVGNATNTKSLTAARM